MDPPPSSAKRKVYQCAECEFTTTSNLARHITNNHTLPRTTDLLPMYERVPKNGNQMITSKFQGTAIMDKLERQESLSGEFTAFKINQKELDNQLLSTLKANTAEIASLKEEIKLLRDSNTLLSATLTSVQTTLHLLESKLSSQTNSSKKTAQLEEVKQSPRSKSIKVKKRVKRFPHSKARKHKKTHK